MPALEEGNLWIRADMQQDISFEASSKMADDIRATLRSYPEITQVVSQMGRPERTGVPATGRWGRRTSTVGLPHLRST